MIVGDYKGDKVEDAKSKLRQKLLDEGIAIVYSEPSDLVTSRSGDVCVVALIDQWYLDYGEESWRKDALKCLERMETFSPEIRNMFKKSFEWMSQWACSRTYGLGTKLPWDAAYLIDSLSDSTIYMAYYAIAHLLQGDLKGTVPGKANIKAESMTPEVYDYIFLGKEKPQTDISDEALELMKKEFEYWYPVNLRVSGKDLVPNHLLFWIYNHVSLFDEKYWPTGVRANGHILLNKKKMSKSTGNYITLREGVDRFSADGMRFALADAGDGIDDANFTVETADGAILKIYTLIEWVKEALANDKHRPSGSPLSVADNMFLHEMREVVERAKKSYEKMEFKEAIKSSFYDFQDKRDKYILRTNSDGSNMHYDLLIQWIRVQAIIVSPICPHFAEHIYSDLLKEEGSVIKAKWPTDGEVDHMIIKQSEYLESNLHHWRVKYQHYVDPPKLKKGATKPPPPTILKVYIANAFPSWRVQTVRIYEQLYKVCKALLCESS